MTSQKEPAEEEPPAGAAAPAKVFEKTPMFSAVHADRYQRQALIREIEAAEPGRTLLCYVADIYSEVSRDDIVGFVDLLYNVRPGEAVDLLLHTPGGDLDAAEKLSTVLRATVGPEAELRVIVPDFAKSAGTLMALGANRIVMSDSSELGTIDPQFPLHDGCGNEMYHSVLSYIRAYEDAKEALRKEPGDLGRRLQFEKFDPTVLRKFKGMRDRARAFAENQLAPRGGAYTQIAHDFMDIDRFPSHRQMINWETARLLGLEIEYLPPTDARWRRYWELYLLQRLAIGPYKKIFESAYVSLVMDAPGAPAGNEAHGRDGSTIRQA